MKKIVVSFSILCMFAFNFIIFRLVAFREDLVKRNYRLGQR